MTIITREYYTVGSAPNIQEFETAAEAVKFAHEWVIRDNVDGTQIRRMKYVGPKVESDDWSDLEETTMLASVSLSGPSTLMWRLANGVHA